jgi:hypothetical protein
MLLIHQTVGMKGARAGGDPLRGSEDEGLMAWELGLVCMAEVFGWITRRGVGY